MARRTQRFRPGGAADAGLERRELLSVARPHAIARRARPIPHLDAFVNDNQGSKRFVNTLSIRLLISQSQTVRVNQAFQAFAYNYLNRPITLTGSTDQFTDIPAIDAGIEPNTSIINHKDLPVGTPLMPPLLSNALRQLEHQTLLALSTLRLYTTTPQPSLIGAQGLAPLADQALLPFARRELSQMSRFLIAHPPRFGPDGKLLNPETLAKVEETYNAILNAVAEFSMHPLLFQSPDDFFINPAVNFPLSFAGTPAKAGPGFFVLGPHGVPLVPAHGRFVR